MDQIFRVALSVDWNSQSVRRHPGPLPPTGIATPNLPLVERLLVKNVDADNEQELDLTIEEGDPTDLDEEFWGAYHALDRALLLERTLEKLRESGKPLSIGELAESLPPTHDLETLSYWLTLARASGADVDQRTESVELAGDGIATRFHVPLVEIDSAAAEQLDAEQLE